METQDEEWKEIWHDDSLSAICAFANTKGGKITIGKNDEGEIVGIDNAEELMVRLPIKIGNSMHFYPDIEKFTENGRTYITITVEQQHDAVDLRGVYYRRSGSNTVRLSGQELRSFVSRRGGIAWPNVVSGNIKLSDLSSEAVSAFIKKGQEAKRISPAADPGDTEGVLRRYGLMTDEGITNAGAILFGKEPFHVTHAATTKIGLFSKGGRLLMEDIIESPVIYQPEEAVKCLFDKYVQPRFFLEGKAMIRVARYQYPQKALREAIYNAIIHRGYLSSIHTTIRVNPDSVEIHNPGELPEGWTAEDLPNKHESIPASPMIAKVFHDLGIIETWGSGITMMQEECKNAGIPQPMYEADRYGIRIVFRSGPWTNDGEEVPVSIDMDGLTPSDIEVYKIIAEGKFVTSIDTATSIGIPLRTVERAISKLKNKDLIYRVGSDKRGTWALIDKR